MGTWFERVVFKYQRSDIEIRLIESYEMARKSQDYDSMKEIALEIYYLEKEDK